MLFGVVLLPYKVSNAACVENGCRYLLCKALLVSPFSVLTAFFAATSAACRRPTKRFLGCFCCATVSYSCASISAAIPRSTSARSSSILQYCVHYVECDKASNVF